MTNTSFLLLADGVARTTFEWGRIQSNTDWILPIGVCLVILLFVRYWYRRDAVELPRLVGWLLTLLRAAAFLGLLFLFLQPHWRSEREETRNSRVLLMVDTSISMRQNDAGSSSAGPSTRTDQVVGALKDSEFLTRLRKTHDVAVIPFSDDLKRDRAISFSKLKPQSESEPNQSEAVAQDDPASRADAPPDWAKLLEPIGVETRIGQALRELIQQERSTPISGVILFSDGGQNAGIAPDAAIALAQEARIPVFTVGLGSDKQPTNVAVCDLAAPARAYPGDRYTVTAYVQAQGMGGQTVTAQLLSRPAGDANDAGRQGTGDVLETRDIMLGGDGEVLPVKFELTPEKVGRQTLVFLVKPPATDRNRTDNRNPTDNLREVDVEIVDRKNHVLLLAGGPTREYQFVRNQLFRDKKSTTVDVLLQSTLGEATVSQDAENLLEEFPATRQEMFDYDCVVAFDPDWQQLTAAQLDLLEKWVGEQGGGLILVGGAVNTCKGVGGWTQDPAMTVIRTLYPVEFPRGLADVGNNAYASEEPWALKFTREGLDADFLWLADKAPASREAWSEFPGVYGFCPIRGPKPGTTVYARFSDPATAQSGQQPPYFAGQFYGSGSVFYMGSGEMWRTRAIDETYFEQFYTKLIRHVSQGRLLRGSSRGVLLVGQDHYILGNTVEVRTQLTNARLEPLEASIFDLQVVQPDGAVQTVALHLVDRKRPGAFQGQFPALKAGTYRLEVAVPDSKERLTRRIQVKVPDLERENPCRNDALLSAIAKGTGGKYYVGIGRLVGADGPDSLVRQLKDKTHTVILTDAPNPQWEETWLRWMMIALCSLLCLEWLIRRLMKLA